MTFACQLARQIDDFDFDEDEKARKSCDEVLEQQQVRYVPLRQLYSATSPCLTASGSVSKKVKARKVSVEEEDTITLQLSGSEAVVVERPPVTRRYSRRRKRAAREVDCDGVLREAECGGAARQEVECDQVVPPEVECGGVPMLLEVKQEVIEEEGVNVGELGVAASTQTKKRRRGLEVVNLGLDSLVTPVISLDGPGPRTRYRGGSSNGNNKNTKVAKKRENVQKRVVTPPCSSSAKRWVRLSFEGVDPKKFIGLQCKVYWPLDADWYTGRVAAYDQESDRHHVVYEDGDEENVILSNEKIKFCISPEEMQCLKLSYDSHYPSTNELDASEMLVLAASLDDCHEIEPGDILWAKLTGYAMWPAIVLDESLVDDRKRLRKNSEEKSVLVQFFGTHDFARVKMKQVISFLKGLLSCYHLKCKKVDFIRSMEEAKMYLSEQKLPKRMLMLRNSADADCGSGSGENGGRGGSSPNFSGGEWIERELQGSRSCLFKDGDLQVLSFGKIVKDAGCSQDESIIWPFGYTAVRKFLSITDPNVSALYKMEVLRSADSKSQPQFRITSEEGEQFEGSTPSSCWNKVYRRIRKIQFCNSDNLTIDSSPVKVFDSGSVMFGFCHPEVLKLIRESSGLKQPSKFSKWTSGAYQDTPIGYRPVHVQWRDLDKCNVCDMDEEYENNLFLQCDKCRMMVHARCYGELEPVNGVLWLCNLCRPGAPECSPPCCLCPVIGGAMKPTTDGRWAHLACAMWIPETCLIDIKKMEPIDGLSRIAKDRWKLLCSICGVSYGACIQCSINTCYVAYHPLCARAAGFCAELADVDRMRVIPVDEDEENQCIRMVSFCKKHNPRPSNELSVSDKRIGRSSCQFSEYTPPLNSSGCARTEPYNYFGRRGRKEPEALAAASRKRSFVENRPYLVGGFCQHESLCSYTLSSSSLEASNNIFSMVEKYEYMRKTFRKRLAFGKSGIHGFGIFTKQPHKAGDMVIEYTGELVRPSIADRREHLIYNSLVGAGTYMFRIDNERVIDATRAGSIAHLINHSCEPNCYSRVISVEGDEHIIIFAKRDINRWEELTYDYRFFSIDEQLACYCGFSRCRGVVNEFEADEQVAKLCVPRSELVDLREN